ncbi:tripartite tricarboxylate transporter substrate binding protein [Azohydromonas caseinilytica]|uniref:Tripartite tricarboxylate transporter substrate binding protein n=1 Tax=Azohydromonas caseinilytica TaxID=2728836 RepID=A0A848FJD3_9BURK|nr:tripartite tricarboxylate transporter substrate binding protein [Azohydromonas caseinilytica]NML17931.1 tripartite tricarboxylate transporter substrate binding protein [Azohydromonas caseinilytica]
MDIHIPRRTALAAAVACTAAALALPALGQAAFPKQKPITLVVPFSPGGGNDILARAVAPKLGQLLGQTIVIENKPGAGGNLGTELVARAEADGYTLVIASSQVTMNPFLGMKVPFRIERDFEPVGRMASVPLVLVSHPGEPYRTLQEFMAYSRAHPGKLSYSSPGNGTPQHLAGEVFAKLNKTEMLHVPYRGTGLSVTDLIAGQVQVSFATYASVAQHIQAGKVRALGIAGQKRTPLAPELPTFGDAGLKHYDASLWYSLLAPARTPPDVVARVNEAMVSALNDPAVAKQLAQQGFETQPSTPAELKVFLASELKRWERVINDNHIKVAP